MEQYRTSLKCLAMGLWLVLMAFGLRLVGTTQAGLYLAKLRFSQLSRMAGECFFVGNITESTASDAIEEPEKPPEELPEELPEPFTPQEAVPVGKEAVDAAALLMKPLSFPQTREPLVLLVHTHTSEAYTMEPGWEYTPCEAFRTQNAEYNMIRVGDALAGALEEAGIGVIHDTTVHDSPEYNGAYDRSYDTIAQNLEQYPSIQIVLDIHRDAVEDGEGNAIPRRAEVAGGACAQLMLVVGTEEGGLPHPNWQENLSFALKLQALLNRQNPGLCRDLSLRPERFNQHFTPCSLLVEVGSNGNTMQEAIRSAQLLGKTLSELITKAASFTGAAWFFVFFSVPPGRSKTPERTGAIPQGCIWPTWQAWTPA